MTRLYGWAPRGKRLVDKIPHGHWKTSTFLAALRNDRIEAPCLYDGPINGERFLAYVEQFLVPTLKPGDIVIVPDESETGTNVLFLRRLAATTLQFRFGPNSYQAHCKLAENADLRLRTVRSSSLSLDVDHPEDLWKWLRYVRVP